MRLEYIYPFIWYLVNYCLILFKEFISSCIGVEIFFVLLGTLSQEKKNIWYSDSSNLNGGFTSFEYLYFGVVKSTQQV